jgi:cytochrome c peroxidase
MRSMPNPVLIVLTIATVVYGTILMLPAREIRYLPDAELRDYALDHGMYPVPIDFAEVLKLVNTPENPVTPARVALGEQLFNDPILSRENTVSCASCHMLDQGGDDNLPTAVGYHGLKNPSHLNSPTVLNAALARSQFWDGRARDVEEQAAGPIQAPFEMNLTPDEAVRKVSAVPAYVKAFSKVFGADGDSVRFGNIQKAIGAYERTLLTRGDYDRFLLGDDTALTASAKRGMNLFMQKGCKGCHTGTSLGGQSIQRFPLHNPPTEVFRTEPFPFPNEGGFLGKDDRKFFRVPILRNITRTAPYFHNGMVEELEEAIRIMSKYQLGKEFTPEQIKDVVEFFKSLEGEIVLYET